MLPPCRTSPLVACPMAQRTSPCSRRSNAPSGCEPHTNEPLRTARECSRATTDLLRNTSNPATAQGRGEVVFSAGKHLFGSEPL